MYRIKSKNFQLSHFDCLSQNLTVIRNSWQVSEQTMHVRRQDIKIICNLQEKCTNVENCQLCSTYTIYRVSVYSSTLYMSQST